MGKSDFLELYGKPVTEENTFKGYEVVKAGEILFSDLSYAICNSYIFVNAVQGVRPTLAR